MEKNLNGILAHATDFMNYCGNIIVSWKLLEHACLAKREIENADEEKKKYLQSKIDDFKVYSQYQLTRNIGISNSILNFDEDLTKITL